MLGRWVYIATVFILLPICSAQAWVWNNPYPDTESTQKIAYSSFPEAPKTLDPAKAYNVNESLFISQIDEPLLEYDYLKRPYRLVPLVASAMPEIRYFNRQGQRIVDPDHEKVAYTQYLIHIQRGIYYQPHPAFAKDAAGQPLYLTLPPDFLAKEHIRSLHDFKQQGRRELISDDFIYQLKRLSSPYVNSPIYGLMQDYIIGMSALNAKLMKVSPVGWLDLRQYDLAGVHKIDDYTFEIRIKGQYQSFLYWLAMHFFVPQPWEVEKFYAQTGMKERNIGLDWNPVGTGPFMLTENNPNRRMVLSKNPLFRPVFFPKKGEEEDIKRGYLKHAGEKLPLVDKVVYTLEKEAIPRWNKFLQGYYDMSAVTADSFDQAIRVNRYGISELSEEMKAKHMRLSETIEPSVYYFGFNMLDPVVGGPSERARLLRLAISLAVNTEERIALFYNGRGEAAQSPIPPGIFGHADINPWLYRYVNGSYQRRPLSVAKEWLRLAGYPNGIDLKTGKPLMLYYDVSASGGPDERAELEWSRKQLAKIGISLNVRATQYNRFQEKMRVGNAQIFSWGWKGDYPDPENFMFLLYGPNGRVKFGGENTANYENLRYDELFNKMRNRKDDPTRAAIIQQMLTLIRHDAPWIWGLHTKTATLSQAWVSPLKPNTLMTNTLKYVSIDVDLRNQMRAGWNQMIFWPLGLALLGLILFFLSLYLLYRHQERRVVARFEDEHNNGI